MNELIERALVMLRKLQWSGTAYFNYGQTEPRCPICEGIKPTEWPRDMVKYGHQHGCELAQLLDDLQEFV